MAANAWDRAQRAIERASRRATERDERVITPDNAVSPFDASSTTVIRRPPQPRGQAGPLDPDLTQRLPHSTSSNGSNGRHRDGSADEDAPGPGTYEDPATVRFAQRRHPGTSPFPVSQVPDEGDGDGRADRADDEPDETPTLTPHRSWWRRLFRR